MGTEGGTAGIMSGEEMMVDEVDVEEGGVRGSEVEVVLRGGGVRLEVD